MMPVLKVAECFNLNLHKESLVIPPYYSNNCPNDKSEIANLPESKCFQAGYIITRTTPSSFVKRIIM